MCKQCNVMWWLYHRWIEEAVNSVVETEASRAEEGQACDLWRWFVLLPEGRLLLNSRHRADEASGPELGPCGLGMKPLPSPGRHPHWLAHPYWVPPAGRWFLLAGCLCTFPQPRNSPLPIVEGEHLCSAQDISGIWRKKYTHHRHTCLSMKDIN